MSELMSDFLEEATGTGPDGWPAGCTSNPPSPEPATEPQAVPLGDLSAPAEEEQNTLLGNRYLCREKSVLFVGPTGIGKSVAALQCAILWGLNRPAFFIRPSGPLRSLIVQAENDHGDLAEMRDGIFRGLDLTPEERATAGQRVLMFQEDELSGFAFIQRLDKLLEIHKPDLVFLDPLFSYIGGNISDQENVTRFLRAWLAPLLRRHSVGNVNLHHSNKPPTGKEKNQWQAGDLAYLGSGHAELANWHRAVLAIRSIGSHDVFELAAGKRAKRLGWQNDDGTPMFSRHIGHGRTGICWRDVDPSEVADATPQSNGRPAKTIHDLLALVPTLPGRIEPAALVAAAVAKKFPRQTARDLIAQGIHEERLVEIQVPRPGIRPAVFIQRAA